MNERLSPSRRHLSSRASCQSQSWRGEKEWEWKLHFCSFPLMNRERGILIEFYLQTAPFSSCTVVNRSGIRSQKYKLKDFRWQFCSCCARRDKHFSACHSQTSSNWLSFMPQMKSRVASRVRRVFKTNSFLFFSSPTQKSAIGWMQSVIVRATSRFASTTCENAARKPRRRTSLTSLLLSILILSNFRRNSLTRAMTVSFREHLSSYLWFMRVTLSESLVLKMKAVINLGGFCTHSSCVDNFNYLSPPSRWLQWWMKRRKVSYRTSQRLTYRTTDTLLHLFISISRRFTSDSDERYFSFSIAHAKLLSVVYERRQK